MSVRHARGMTTTITPLALSEAKARLRAVWDRLGDISFETGHVDVSFNASRDFRSLFASKYGPTVAVYRNIDPARTTELDHAIDDLCSASEFVRHLGGLNTSQGAAWRVDQEVDDHVGSEHVEEDDAAEEETRVGGRCQAG